MFKHAIFCFYLFWMFTKFKGQDQTNAELPRIYSEIYFWELTFVPLLYVIRHLVNYFTYKAFMIHKADSFYFRSRRGQKGIEGHMS